MPFTVCPGFAWSSSSASALTLSFASCNNPRQERAAAYLAERGSITNREFRELCPELSDETIRRELSDMVDQGLIMKVGDRKATYYILK